MEKALKYIMGTELRDSGEYIEFKNIFMFKKN